MYLLYFIYLLAQRLAYLIAWPVACFSKNEKLRLFIGERAISYFNDQLQKLGEHPQHARVYWLHVSSAGELEQAIPVLRYLFEKGGIRFFVTYFSPSAKPFLKNVPGLLAAMSFPIDSITNHLKIIKQANISRVLFVRYDVWPGLLLACRKKNLPISLLAATKTRARKSFASALGFDTRRYFFSFFNSIFAVSDADAAYYKSLAPNASVFFAGDPKWARAKERVESLKQQGLHHRLGVFSDFCFAHKNQLGRACFVFGSPHAEEHEVAIRCATLASRPLILYAPGEMDEANLKRITEDFKKAGTSIIRMTLLVELLEQSLAREGRSSDNPPRTTTRPSLSAEILAETVVLIDRMGLLAEIYALADVAIVGGGYDGQIHNTLEPAAHPVAVVFGNKLTRALEAQKLVDAKAAKSFESTMKLFEFLAQCSSLRKADATELSFVQELASMRLRALELFGEMPDTNKIIADSLI